MLSGRSKNGQDFDFLDFGFIQRLPRLRTEPRRDDEGGCLDEIPAAAQQRVHSVLAQGRLHEYCSLLP
nr:unnamed protein product [Haemonchus contortus]